MSEELKENVLEEVEKELYDELKFLSDKDTDLAKKIRNLQVTDRKIKVANVIVSIENFKERKYMNRTNRIDARRKVDEAKKA